MQKNMSSPKCIALENLYTLADGFNIEGGNLEILTTENQRWMNICMPLDFPLLTNQTLEDITLANTFSLKEMSIREYNESNVNLFVMLVVEYFRLEGKKLLIHVHRGRSGMIFIEKITNMLLSHYTDGIEFVFIDSKFPILRFENGFELKLINGYEPSTIKNHPEFKNLFSISLMGGLNAELEPGSITLPSKFVPFDVDRNIVDFSREYTVNNYLIDILDNVLSLPQENFFETINNFPSENLDKHHPATRLCQSNIKFDNVRVLQINRLYNPRKSDGQLLATIITDE